MKNMSGKIVAWLNDGARDYVYGPRRWFSPLRIVFVVMVAFVASLVGNAFAHYMVHATVDNGTFEDGVHVSALVRDRRSCVHSCGDARAPRVSSSVRGVCAAIGRERRGRQPR